MRTRTTQLEWQFAEDAEGWDQLAGSAVVPKRLPQHIVWGGLLALLVLLGTAGGRLWHTAHLGLVTLENEVDAAVNADVWSEHQEVAEVQLLDLAGDTAVVEVELPAAAGLPVLRQTRVYHQTSSGWTRTTPSAATWGRPRRLETTHFVFAYHERDEEVVKAAAAHLERLYLTLYAAFFTEPPPTDKRLFEVDPAAATGDFILWHKRPDPQDALVVASPAAYLAPGDMTPEELLTQSIVLALLQDFELQQAMKYETSYQRELQPYGMALPLWPVVSGIGLWQLWAIDLPLAQWREPVVQWGLRDADAISDQSRIKPSFEPALCAMHDLWMDSPLYIHLPFTCDERFEQSQAIDLWLRSRPLRRVTPLSLTDQYILAGHAPNAARVIALATMVEYAAATYGPERIPELLVAMHGFTQWEPLVFATFGVTAEEYETGWADYLAAHYGVTKIH